MTGSSDHVAKHHFFARTVEELARAKKWREVEVLGKRCLVDYPSSIYVMKRLGHALEKQGKVDDAIACYENAIAHARGAAAHWGREAGHANFIQRLDILYRRQKKYAICFQLCLYYADTHRTARAYHLLARAADLVGHEQLRIVAITLRETLNRPVMPRGNERDTVPVPDAEDIEIDIDGAIDRWNEVMPADMRGMLEAVTVSEGVVDVEYSNETERHMRVKPKPRPRYSEGDINRVIKAILGRLD